MISDPLTFVLLAFAAYRLTRLAGWDDFPLAAKIRAWAIGERWVAVEMPEIIRLPADELSNVQRVEAPFTDPELEAVGRSPFEIPDLPGKQPSSEAEAVRPAYDRPTLAHFVQCPFCVGFHISVAVWITWILWPPVMYVLVPFAISGAVGLIAKNWDP